MVTSNKGYGLEAEHRMYDWFVSKGFRALHIKHMGGDAPDEGDLLLYRYAPEPDTHMVRCIRRVDVKRYRKFTGSKLPEWDRWYISNHQRPHPDWWYCILNDEMTHMVFIDMAPVPPDELEYSTSHGQHPVSGDQMYTWSVPRHRGRLVALQENEHG